MVPTTPAPALPELPAGIRIAIDATCPSCGHYERNFDPATGLFGCSRCDFTSTNRSGLSERPREGHSTVTIEINVETNWAGCGATDVIDVDAQWWDAMDEDDQEEWLAATASEVLAQYASSGASVVGRTESDSSSATAGDR